MIDNQPKILVADDDALIRKAAVRILAAAGYTVTQAADGEEAVALARVQQPDLILLDVNMPGLDGFQVLARLKADPQLAASYVVIVSGSRVDTDNQVHGLDAGADGYLTRDIGNRELVAQVQALLRIKRAEDALRHSEHRFRSLFAAAATGIALSNTDGQILQANPALCRMLGYTEAELVEQNFFELTHPDDRAENRTLHEQLVSGEIDHFVMEKRYLPKDGRIIWARVSVSTQRDTIGQPTAIISIAEDISQRKQAEETIHQRNETLALLYQAGQALSQSLDPQTIYRRLYGWVSTSIPCDAFFVANYDHDEELIHCVYAIIEGQTIPADQLPPIPLEPEGMGTQSIVIRSGKPLLISNYQEYMVRTITHYDVDKEGKVQEKEQADTNSALLVPMILAGRVVGVIQLMSHKENAFSEEQLQLLESLAAYAVVAQNNALLFEKANREIAERKRAEAAIRTLNAELEQRVAERTRELNAINEELEAFSYSVSHDLRAPLRAIDGWGQALVEDYGDVLGEDGGALLQRQRAASQRMGQLIDDLLRLSRLTRRPLNRQPVDLAELVATCWQELASEHQPLNAALVIGELPPCQADPSLLRQVITNLLSNGLKFASQEAQPRLEVDSQAAADNELVYFVRDNGVGFDPRYSDKLFSPFQRLHSQHEFSGTGIGLAIVQRVIYRHGGRVWAESELGQGATLYFSLPDDAASS